MSWAGPVVSLGFLVALVVIILAVVLFALGRLSLEWALAICAVCAVRL